MKEIEFATQASACYIMDTIVLLRLQVFKVHIPQLSGSPNFSQFNCHYLCQYPCRPGFWRKLQQHLCSIFQQWLSKHRNLLLILIFIHFHFLPTNFHYNPLRKIKLHQRKLNLSYIGAHLIGYAFQTFWTQLLLWGKQKLLNGHLHLTKDILRVFIFFSQDFLVESKVPSFLQLEVF